MCVCVFNRLLHTSHPFPCPECGEAFKRRKDLDLHSLTHQGESSGHSMLFYLFILYIQQTNFTPICLQVSKHGVHSPQGAEGKQNKKNLMRSHLVMSIVIFRKIQYMSD